MIIGGEHRYIFEDKDYVLAAIALYLDIINLFVKLLSLFGKKK
jgi:FtsH-binding integral membrane protein